MAGHMRTELVEDALKAAWRERGSLAGAVFHGDHGSVYTSKAYAGLCEQFRVIQSMGAIGSSDNALAESFNAALRRGDHHRRECDVDQLLLGRRPDRVLTTGT